VRCRILANVWDIDGVGDSAFDAGSERAPTARHQRQRADERQHVAPANAAAPALDRTSGACLALKQHAQILEISALILKWHGASSARVVPLLDQSVASGLHLQSELGNVLDFVRAEGRADAV
jgi:hypothetical protein